MPNIQERANSQRQANIVYKVTQATNLMKANGAMINGFESTDAFVDELQKYLKIMKRCDSEHIADCWPTKKVRISDKTEYDVTKAKTRRQLNYNDDYQNNKNVGIILADGACLIMTYNPANSGISIGASLTTTSTSLPVGGKYKEFLEYTSNTTAGLAFVMDVNGSKGPNSETIGTKMYDIRSFNGARFSNSFEFIIIDTPTSYDCTKNQTNTYCTSYPYYSEDQWAGGMNDCIALGGHVPSAEELINICNSDTLKDKYGLTNYHGFIWASDLYGDGRCARIVGFNSDWATNYCNLINYDDRNFRAVNRKILCMGD